MNKNVFPFADTETASSSSVSIDNSLSMDRVNSEQSTDDDNDDEEDTTASDLSTSQLYQFSYV